MKFSKLRCSCSLCEDHEHIKEVSERQWDCEWPCKRFALRAVLIQWENGDVMESDGQHLIISIWR